MCAVMPQPARAMPATNRAPLNGKTGLFLAKVYAVPDRPRPFGAATELTSEILGDMSSCCERLYALAYGCQALVTVGARRRESFVAGRVAFPIVSARPRCTEAATHAARSLASQRHRGLPAPP